MQHLAPIPFDRSELYLETLGLKSFIPRATARSVPDAVELQYMLPAFKPLVNAHALF
ncbi:MAG: hypothetical protein WCI54_18205 [Bacteroidia bacterium]